MIPDVREDQSIDDNTKLSPDPQAPALYVDVDGTLIKTDLLVESALRLLVRNPLFVFAMIVWLWCGRSVLKHEIAKRVSIDVTCLPYQAEFVRWLRIQARDGRRLILATASDKIYALAIAKYLGLFCDVLASDSGRNLKGAEKLKAIKEHAAGLPFDYAGNGREDLVVWREARSAVLVNVNTRVSEEANRVAKIEASFSSQVLRPLTWLKAIRIHQWAKNILLATALFTSFRFFDFASVIKTLFAFLSFGLVASSTYLINDLLDLDSDRQHSRKRFRPLASGDIGIVPAVGVLCAMLMAGIFLAAKVSLAFLLAVAIYLAVTISYSFHLKRYMLIDVLCLAGLYTWRIIAGAIAIDIDMSNWLLAFSMFMFLSLALVKRCAELINLSTQSQIAAKGRDYRVTDSSALIAMGATSGYLAVLVLALFIDSPATAAHYTWPRMLWGICPPLLYWISRLWLKTMRGEMHDDPIVFALRDRASWLIAVVVCGITLMAK